MLCPMLWQHSTSITVETIPFWKDGSTSAPTAMSRCASRSGNAKRHAPLLQICFITLAGSSQTLRTVSINIWHLISARQAGNLSPPRYQNRRELQQDLRNDRGRRFPLSKVNQSEDNRLLRALLVTIRWSTASQETGFEASCVQKLLLTKRSWWLALNGIECRPESDARFRRSRPFNVKDSTWFRQMES